MKLNPYRQDLVTSLTSLTSFQVIESGKNSNFIGQKPNKHDHNQVIKVNIVSYLYHIPPYHVTRKALDLCCILFKYPQLRSYHKENNRKTQIWCHSTRHCPVLPKIVQVMKIGKDWETITDLRWLRRHDNRM